MNNNSIMITLAYPETIVRISDEWWLNYLHLVGIGKKNYVRAGHAALVLIHKESQSLDYYDFGRYISPLSTGRVRSKITDHELDFPLRPMVRHGKLENLDELLIFLATHPNLTHGQGTMYASVCDAIHFESAKTHIAMMQDQPFIRYAAFARNATNCARFVTDALIAGITDQHIKKRLVKSNRFTPSTIGNVINANTNGQIYQVSIEGKMEVFKSSARTLNRRLFFDRLTLHRPNLIGNLEPNYCNIASDKAQWLPGIGGGAWFELHGMDHEVEYRFRRISPHGNIDVDGVYQLKDHGFDINSNFKFAHASNCKSVQVNQQDAVYRFDFLRKYC